MASGVLPSTRETLQLSQIFDNFFVCFSNLLPAGTQIIQNKTKKNFPCIFFKLDLSRCQVMKVLYKTQALFSTHLVTRKSFKFRGNKRINAVFHG